MKTLFTLLLLANLNTVSANEEKLICSDFDKIEVCVEERCYCVSEETIDQIKE